VGIGACLKSLQIEVINKGSTGFYRPFRWWRYLKQSIHPEEIIPGLFHCHPMYSITSLFSSDRLLSLARHAPQMMARKQAIATDSK
jgi:hypothetical protein